MPSLYIIKRQKAGFQVTHNTPLSHVRSDKPSLLVILINHVLTDSLAASINIRVMDAKGL